MEVFIDLLGHGTFVHFFYGFAYIFMGFGLLYEDIVIFNEFFGNFKLEIVTQSGKIHNKYFYLLTKRHQTKWVKPTEKHKQH